MFLNSLNKHANRFSVPSVLWFSFYVFVQITIANLFAFEHFDDLLFVWWHDYTVDLNSSAMGNNYKTHNKINSMKSYTKYQNTAVE